MKGLPVFLTTLLAAMSCIHPSSFASGTTTNGSQMSVPYGFPAPGVIWYVAEPERTLNVLPLRQGWNLVSLAYEPTGSESIQDQLATILDSVISVWGWDHSLNAWMVYSPPGEATSVERPPAPPGFPVESPEIMPLESLRSGTAYWFEMADQATLFLEGTPDQYPPPMVGLGWHMAGVERAGFEKGALLSPQDVLFLALVEEGTIWSWLPQEQTWAVFSTDSSLSELSALYGENLRPLEAVGPRDGFWVEIKKRRVEVFQAPDPHPRGMFYDDKFVYVQGLSTGMLYRIDPQTGALLATISPPAEGFGLGADSTWDGEHIWSMHWSIIAKLRIEGDRLVTVAEYEMRPRLHHMFGIVWDGSYLWTAAAAGGLFKHDRDHMTQEEILEDVPTGLSYITHVEYVGGDIYAVNGTPYLYVLDPDDPRGKFQIGDTFTLPARRPSGLAWDGTYLWVCDEQTGRIYKIPGDSLSRESYDLMDDYLRAGEVPTELASLIENDMTLTKDGSPYVASIGLEVPDGVTLTIEPGVRILFPEYTGVMIWGRVVAQGTPEEPIVFSHLYPWLRWGGIIIGRSSTPLASGSILRYCRIQHVTHALEAQDSSPEIRYCWIRGAPYGKDTAGGIAIKPAQAEDVNLVGNVCAAEIDINLGESSQGEPNPGTVQVVENHGGYVFVRGGRAVQPGYVARNLLRGGMVVYDISGLRIENNQLSGPVELGGIFTENVEFTGNLVESDYKPNGIGGSSYSITATHNTMTNGFSFGGIQEDLNMQEEFYVHFNNLLGGVGSWQLGDKVYYPYLSLVGTPASQTIDVSENWWGTADPQVIPEFIWDHTKDSNEAMAGYEPVLGEPDPHGFVRGRVYDALTGRPLPGASVQVGDHSTLTAADGYFALTVPAGTHAAFVTAEGYRKVKMDRFVVAAASVTHLEAGMTRGTGEVSVTDWVIR